MSDAADAEDVIPEIPRRDRPIPASWYKEDPEPSVVVIEETRVLNRAAKVWRYLALATAVLLVSNAVSFVLMYFSTSAEARPELVFSFFYIVIVQVLGWSFVGWAARRR